MSQDDEEEEVEEHDSERSEDNQRWPRQESKASSYKQLTSPIMHMNKQAKVRDLTPTKRPISSTS